MQLGCGLGCASSSARAAPPAQLSTAELSCPGLRLGLGLGQGPGAEREGGRRPEGPSPLITVQPSTKLYFCQSWATLEPHNKYIIYDT